MARRERRSEVKSDISYNDKFQHKKKTALIFPKSPKQRIYDSLLHNPHIDMVISVGPAGSGKTLFACYSGIRALQKGCYKKIVLTRPTVSVDEQHGFLPGDLNKKMEPWTKPIFDIFEEHYHPRHLSTMLQDGVIEICPLAYMRGRTFKNAWVIADEMQNATPNQMKMLLTRIGDNSKFVITGDLEQHDRGYEENGLQHFMNLLKLNPSDRLGYVQMHNEDVQRHPAVVEILNMYK